MGILKTTHVRAVSVIHRKPGREVENVHQWTRTRCKLQGTYQARRERIALKHFIPQSTVLTHCLRNVEMADVQQTVCTIQFMLKVVVDFKLDKTPVIVHNGRLGIAQGARQFPTKRLAHLSTTFKLFVSLAPPP